MILSLEKLTNSTPTKIRKERKKKSAIKTVRSNGEVEPMLLDLVRLRVAQIHGCKWCAQDHIKTLIAQGETRARLRRLGAWRQAPIFSDREEAALNLAEALTRNEITAVPDDIMNAAFLFFNEGEILCLILAILAANDWYYLKGFPNSHMTGRPPHE